MSAHQNFWFSFSDYLLAEAGGVPLDALHLGRGSHLPRLRPA